MGTTVHSIGTASRDYSTLQAWEDAAPANLVTDGNIWQGQCYNDSEFTAGVVISGSTSDSTHYKELTCASGQSFQDNANVRTNALTYNQSNGVGVNAASDATALVQMLEDYCRVSKLQIKKTGAFQAVVSNNKTGNILKDCIIVATNNSIDRILDVAGGSGTCTYANLLVINTGSGSGSPAFVVSAGTPLIVGCSVVRLTSQTAAGTGYLTGTSGAILQSCTSFGFTTCASGTWDTTNSKDNATEQSSGFPGSGNQYSVTYNATTPFTQAGSSGTDLRSIASTTLAANGFLDSTNAPKDISATSRANPPTIGHWELTGGGGGPAAILGLPQFGLMGAGTA